jgi:hypothetical protein
LECLKDFHQEDSQKSNLFLEPIILKTLKAHEVFFDNVLVIIYLLVVYKKKIIAYK